MKQYWYYCGFRSHFLFMEKIKGFENYSVTRDGKIWSHKRNKFIKHYINNRGYCYVQLSNIDKRLTTSVHRIVASAYIPNNDYSLEVNHINGIKTDNKVENLEWCTHMQNQLHAYSTGLMRDKRKVLLDKSTGIYYNSIREAAELLGYNKGTLKDYMSGKRKNKTTLVLA